MYPLNRLPRPEPFSDVEFAVNFPIQLPGAYRNLLREYGFTRIASRGELTDIDDVLETAGYFMADSLPGDDESTIGDYIRFCAKIEVQWRISR